MAAAVLKCGAQKHGHHGESKKVARIKTEGEIREAEMLTISGMVPAARHAALIAPTTANSAMIIALTSQTDSKAAKRSFFAEILRESP